MPELLRARTAQYLFDAVPPATGYLVQNQSPFPLWVADGAPADEGSGIRIDPGATFVTPPGYRPRGPVSVFGTIQIPQRFAALSW
jgi:hypothetical protein